ncbi:MAG: hypothetical protein AABN33_13585 [Acidobacteriota bacterium]
MLGERDEAIAELAKAYQERDWFLPRLKVDPFFESMRDYMLLEQYAAIR